MFQPNEDGITHINICSKGKTELGRLLSNFAHTPFWLQGAGRFESVEGYWFWLGTEVDKAKVSVHVYDSDGKLAEEPDSWEKGHFAAAHVIPKATGSYFIIVSVEQSPEERTHWALVYGFR